ncbi:MAG: uracil-DNA glycosylase [Trueperaceae bacterium]|nr:uracil-DNA glycosylase [Trueperaceae bacterium]
MNLAELRQLAAVKPPALGNLADNLVFGEGDPDARLMIVGEAPGEDEDIQGRPFVGRAGQLLDKILASVGIERESVYITNMVKFRPPGNRNPTPEEIAASEELLMAQIAAIAPQVIATLGNVPTQYFLKTTDGITKTHGKRFDWHEIIVFPLYHPAYLLRNASREKGAPKWQTWEDMQALRALLAGLPPKQSGSKFATVKQEALF